jgi:cold shock protein
MPLGTVKWFDGAKGWGFIVGEDGRDVFVHHSQIRMEGWRALREGERVTYEPIETEKGVAAQDVARLEKSKS